MEDAMPLSPEHVMDISVYSKIMQNIKYHMLSHVQRKLGSNTSELRTNRILRLEMMKGGMSSNNI